MIRDPNHRQLMLAEEEMNTEEKMLFLEILRKTLSSPEIEEILSRNQYLKKVIRRNPKLIYILVHKDIERKKEQREEIMVNMMCPTEKPYEFKTVGTLEIVADDLDSSDNGHCKVPENSFKDLKNMSHEFLLITEDNTNNARFPSIKLLTNKPNNQPSLQEAVDLTYKEITMVRNGNYK